MNGSSQQHSTLLVEVMFAIDSVMSHRWEE